jgi:hypothetical protein
MQSGLQRLQRQAFRKPCSRWDSPNSPASKNNRCQSCTTDPNKAVDLHCLSLAEYCNRLGLSFVGRVPEIALQFPGISATKPRTKRFNLSQGSLHPFSPGHMFVAFLVSSCHTLQLLVRRQTEHSGRVSPSKHWLGGFCRGVLSMRSSEHQRH